ncbi:MAG: ribosome maturation factor RimP [Clostridiales bacterium]|nr:ribosome maturation factor RimP [Clostridiales bacterium]
MRVAAAKTTDRVFALAEPLARELGLSVWDVRFVKEGASWYLRIFIDKPEGVGIEDCEAMSRAVDPLLDEADFISQSYYLEVSSPGLGRELSRPEHFARYMGEPVKVRLIRARDGRKEWTGRLTGYDGGVTVSPDKTAAGGPEPGREEIRFEKAEISRVNLLDDFF